MKGMDAIKKFRRSPIDFPVAENTKCYLSSATIISGISKKGPWIGVRFLHATEVPNLSDVGGGIRLAFFKDIHFLPNVDSLDDMSAEDKGVLSTFMWNANYIGKVVNNVDIPSIEGRLYREWLSESVGILNSLPRNMYYVKTVLKPTKYMYLVLSRGYQPYISLTPTMSYRHGEDEYHSYIINIDIEKAKKNAERR